MSTVTEETPKTTETTTDKWVYLFEEGPGDDKALLGGKGAGLCEMTRAGLPVPPGLVVTTEACNAFFDNDKNFPDGMWDQVKEGLKKIEEKVGKRFGDPKNPLLVSVRSGAAFSMPGMMDTVLNLGLNPDTVAGLIKLTDNERFGYDAWRRFVARFGHIVLDIPATAFDEPFASLKAKRGVKLDTELTADDLREAAHEYRAIVRNATGKDFPTDPHEQLRLA